MLQAIQIFSRKQKSSGFYKTESRLLLLQVFNNKYFMVEIDDLRPESTTSRSYICHVNCPDIFPVQWSLKNGLHLNPPAGTYMQYQEYCFK